MNLTFFENKLNIFIHGGDKVNTKYIIGTLFFLTGSLMLFIHKVISTAVHILGNFVNEKTIKLNGDFDLISYLFLIIGISIYLFTYIKEKKSKNSTL